jgi:hypothetical protein
MIQPSRRAAMPPGKAETPMQQRAAVSRKIGQPLEEHDFVRFEKR